MQATPQHTYQILTKRPDRMADVTASMPMLPNAWLGTSVESAGCIGRIDDLREVDAAVRFVSFEPLLGSVAAERHTVGNRRWRERPAFASNGRAVGRGN
jgi:protein gp37